MSTKKPISKKIRFEVFKRDHFTCQYCGRSAPDAILEVDHLTPVAEGGENDLLNLVTSCRECNRGKGKKKLSDNSVVEKQRAQLHELAEKREQVEMMIQWRDELRKLKEMEVDSICNDFFNETRTRLDSNSREKVRRLISEFSYLEVMDAMDIAINKYYSGNNFNSARVAFSKIGGICNNRKFQNEKKHQVNYLRERCIAKFGECDEAVLIEIVKRIRTKDDFISVINDFETRKTWEDFTLGNYERNGDFYYG